MEHGGPGINHFYFECFEDFLPAAGLNLYYDQLGCDSPIFRRISRSGPLIATKKLLTPSELDVIAKARATPAAVRRKLGVGILFESGASMCIIS